MSLSSHLSEGPPHGATAGERPGAEPRSHEKSEFGGGTPRLAGSQRKKNPGTDSLRNRSPVEGRSKGEAFRSCYTQQQVFTELSFSARN